MRIAIFFTPPADHPLTRAAALWLGRDPFTGAEFAQTAVDGFTRREVRELTEEDFKHFKPISEFPELVKAIEAAREEMRARGQRGPQKTPTKERVTLRLDREIVARYRDGGPGWQTRLNDDLVKLNKRRKHG